MILFNRKAPVILMALILCAITLGAGQLVQPPIDAVAKIPGIEGHEQ